MKSNKWKPCEHEWVSFDETYTYEKFKKNESTNENKEENLMEMELHNQVDINHKRTLSTIQFFMNAVLGKFSKNDKWKLEVWLDENQNKHNASIVCGMALKRPRRATIYTRKKASSLKDAVKNALKVIEKSIRREGHRWARAQVS